MDTNEKALILLDRFDFISYKKKETLLDLIKSPGNIFNKSFMTDYKSQLIDLLGDEEYTIFENNCNDLAFNTIIKELDKQNISVITSLSPLYPESLLNTDTPPFVLYYKGNISLLNSNSNFAIVGTRHITSYGKMVTEKFTRELVNNDFNIVSGLAVGVDSIAHNTTLANNGKTIAVLAGGLDKIYPANNTMLAKRIVDSGGLIISEIRPNRKAEPYMFPIRNRIIAGICKGVLITEAQEKSGSMHTKNFALDYGKDVFAVPGDIFSISSEGTNRMITNGHAKLVSKIEDILCEYNLQNKPIKKTEIDGLSNDEKAIISLLKTGEKTFQDIVESTGFEAKKVNSLLTMLTIREIIKKLVGNIYFLNS